MAFRTDLNMRTHFRLNVKVLADNEEERSIDVLQDDTYGNVLEKLELNPEEVVVLRNGTPVPEDEEVDRHNGERGITVIRIVSGG